MTETNRVITHDEITKLAKLAIAEAIERHRRLGESIAIWRDGKVVVLTADQIPPMKSKDNESNGSDSIIR
jgi:20S proteasome alpha/beta subunit